ncbi:hypothetical protein Mapa_001983 [Marchantia paleacea]|nr:hypothetical protein Mapa_001983 [Marchantia paleacea]
MITKYPISGCWNTISIYSLDYRNDRCPENVQPFVQDDWEVKSLTDALRDLDIPWSRRVVRNSRFGDCEGENSVLTFTVPKSDSWGFTLVGNLNCLENLPYRR